MYLHDQSQIIAHFGNSVLCLDFIDPSQNHCSFHELSANIVRTLENVYKEIVQIGLVAWGGG